MLKRLLAPLMLAVLCAVGAAADDGDDMMNKLVNAPRVESWNVQGLAIAPKPFDDPSVQGGRAVRVAVPGKSANQWDISARVTIDKPIAKGDTVLLAFWAKAEVPAEGQQTANLAGIRIEQTKTPYGAFAQDQAEVGGTWTMIYASGVADQDYPKGALDATVQLAVAKQTVDFGPCFVFDMGPGYDQSKLPHNKLTSAAPSASNTASAAQPTIDPIFAPEIARLRALMPVQGRLMNDPSAAQANAYGADQTHAMVDAPGIPGGKALSVSVTHTIGGPYSVGTGTQIIGDIRKGDVVFFAVYARATQTSNEGQYGTISAINVQLNHDPWTVVAGTAAQAPLNTWQVFYGSGTSQIDVPSGQASFSVQFGRRKQTIEFGPSFIFDLGPGADTTHLPVNKITYPGREANAPWRAEATARIRKFRMGDLAVTVSDPSGHPVAGAKVHIAMQRHLYRFGGFAGFDLTSATGPDGDTARAVFLKTFNFATSPIYWSDWGWADATMHGHMIDTMAWLQQHGYAFRGHPVVYPREDLTPTYVKKLAGNPAAVKEAILGHVRDVVPITAKYGACCLDVVNEPEDGQYLPGIAGADIFDQAYVAAHAAAPDLHLFINDYGIVTGGGTNDQKIAAYHKFIDDMIAKGVPLGGIGIQGHFGGELTDPGRVVAIIDDFAKYHVPIEITEFDVETGDEQAQADYTRDILTAAFSDPATDAFVTWGWRDTEHPQLSMFHKDWSPKPNGEAWMKLIYHDWWTDETDPTSADGTATVHAFYGDYKITVAAGGKSVTKDVTFAPGSGPVSVTLP